MRALHRQGRPSHEDSLEPFTTVDSSVSSVGAMRGLASRAARYWRQRRYPRQVRVSSSIVPSPGPLVNLRVAGSSFRKDVLERLARQARSRSFPIALRVDEDNEYDEQAVAVVARLGLIGFVPAEVVGDWRVAVLAEAETGRTVCGEAHVEERSGGWAVLAKITRPERFWEPIEARARRSRTAWGPRRRESGPRVTRRRRERFAFGRTRQTRRAVGERSHERLLHYHLEQFPYPYEWKAQVGFGPWRLDLYCEFALLSVEVDGPEHQSRKARERDEIRDSELARHGIRTIRFRNEEVAANPTRVARRVLAACCSRTGFISPNRPESPWHSWTSLPPIE
jgi:very-short-patch-repair endonuclease